MERTEIALEEPIDQETFAEYGQLLSTVGRRPDAETDDFSFWDALGEPELTGPSIGVVRSYPKEEFLCPSLERHGETAETLIPVHGEIVVVCALSRTDDPRRADLSTAKAVRVQRGRALILRPGVWHYAPLVDDGPVDTFVIFQRATLETDLLTEELSPERMILVRK